MKITLEELCQAWFLVLNKNLYLHLKDLRGIQDFLEADLNTVKHQYYNWDDMLDKTLGLGAKNKQPYLYSMALAVLNARIKLTTHYAKTRTYNNIYALREQSRQDINYRSVKNSLARRNIKNPTSLPLTNEVMFEIVKMRGESLVDLIPHSKPEVNRALQRC